MKRQAKLTSEDLTTRDVVWLKVHEAVRTRGLSRSHLYELIRSKAIISANMRKAGNIRGVRLISAESLDAYIESYVS